MNCHDNNKKDGGTHKHNPMKHMLHMAICCGLPVIIIVLLPFIARLSPAAGRILGVISPFICPIMMLVMMPMMFGGRKKESCCSDNTREQDKSVNANL